MFRPTAPRLAALVLCTSLLIACGGTEEDAAREIELPPAPADAPVNDQPAPSGTAPAASPAPATASATRRPAAPPPSTSRVASLAAGTTLRLAADGRICTNTHKVADRFTASLTQPVTGANGAVLDTATAVTFEVVESARGENNPAGVKFAFKAVAVTVAGAERPFAADITEVAKIDTVRVQSNTTQAGKVATGAAIGAVAGQILGKDTKSTVAGAAIGAAAGGAVAAGTTDYDGCLKANGAIAVVLKDVLRM